MKSSIFIKFAIVGYKQTVRGDFFDITLLLQPDGVFDSESNGRSLSSRAPPDGEKKILSFDHST